MSQTEMQPLEGMLRAIGQTAPQPWYPRLHAQRTGAPLDALYYYLEHLWLDGLVTKGPGTAETGPGVVLTERGQEVLRDEELLQRLREGLALTPGERGGTVREVVRRQVYPLVTRLLVLSNVLVFAWGLWLASPNSFGNFLGAMFNADAKVFQVLKQTGAVWAPALLRGESWRLLANCWVHIGLLHLLVNMYALNGLGRSVEQMYGRWRYLLLYVLAGFCGSCLGMTPQAIARPPYPILAGASGAVCGIFGAEAVWVLLNGKLLPRSLNKRWQANLLTNFFLLFFISLFPGVSGMAHLGGAVAGAVAGLLFSWERFGHTPLRWLALPALGLLPYTGLYLLNNARATLPEWRELERREQEQERTEFKENLLKKSNKTLRDAFELCDRELAPLLRHIPADREQAEQDRAFQELARQRQSLIDLDGRMQKAGPFRNEEVEKARQSTRAYIAGLVEWMDAIQGVVAAGDKVTPQTLDQLKARRKAATRLNEDWKLLEAR